MEKRAGGTGHGAEAAVHIAVKGPWRIEREREILVLKKERERERVLIVRIRSRPLGHSIAGLFVTQKEDKLIAQLDPNWHTLHNNLTKKHKTQRGTHPHPMQYTLHFCLIIDSDNKRKA